LKKRTKKLLCLEIRDSKQKFFASFFQKRSAFFLLARLGAVPESKQADGEANRDDREKDRVPMLIAKQLPKHLYCHHQGCGGVEAQLDLALGHVIPSKNLQ